MTLPESYHMEPQKRWTLRHWVIFVSSALGLMIICPLILALLPIWDIEPVDDSALQIRPTPVPEAENAWSLVETIAERLSGEANDFIYPHKLNNPEERLAALEWFQGFEEMDKLRTVLDTPYCQPPFPENYGEMLPIFDPYSKISSLFRLQLYSQDSVEERYQAWMDCFRFQKQLESTMSAMIMQVGPKHLLYDISQDSLLPAMSVSQLKDLLAACDQLNPDLSEAWCWELLAEYQYQHRILQEVGWKGYWDEFYAYRKPPIAEWPVIPLLYQPNRTQAWIGETYQAALYRLDPEKFPFPTARDVTQMKYGEFNREGIRMVGHVHNLYGMFLLFVEFPALHIKRIDEILNNYQWNLLAVRLSLCLLIHEKEQGQLPASLSELVPDFFVEVPVDPFDGQPVRYQPELRTFYSVGLNGTDEGGIDLSRQYEGDLVMVLPGGE